MPTQYFDDGSSITTDNAGNVLATTDTAGHTVAPAPPGTMGPLGLSPGAWFGVAAIAWFLMKGR